MPAGHAELRERVLEANRAIVRAGLVVLTFGNASALDRDAGVMAIKPSGVRYDELGPDRSSSSTSRAARSSTASLPAVLRHADAPRPLPRASRRSAGSCTRTRRSRPPGRRRAGRSRASARRTPTTSTVACRSRGALTAEEIDGDYETSTGDAIVETFATLGLDPLEMPAVLVASHGPFAWGADAAEAVENAVALEAVAALALGPSAARRAPGRSRTSCSSGTSRASTGLRRTTASLPPV